MILPQPIVDVHPHQVMAMMTMDRWQSAKAAQEFSMSGMIFPISIA
jgi:predicted signal transduction protein with EAL and GGDEF domain